MKYLYSLLFLWLASSVIAPVNGYSQTITTVAGSGELYYTEEGSAALEAQLGEVSAVLAGGSGTFYLSSEVTHKVYKVDASGNITTVAGTGEGGYNGDGILAIDAQLNFPGDLQLDAAGNLYIADRSNHRIRKVAADGMISTIAGNGEAGYNGDNVQATSAQLFSPSGIAFDASGNLYIADRNNYRIRRVSTSGMITTVGGDGNSGFSGDGGPATAARLDGPAGVDVDASGNVYIADMWNNCVRKINTSGTISTFAGIGGDFGYSGDGGAATAAKLTFPVAVEVGSGGKIYIVDRNVGIRVVSSGVINTVAGGNSSGFAGDGGPATDAAFDLTQDVSLDGAGNYYIADHGNSRIRKVNTSGIVNTVAGSGIFGYNGDDQPALEAQLLEPQSVTVDSQGNLYIADSQNHRVRKVDPSGTITTIAGNGTSGFSGDGEPATSAQLNAPYDVRVDQTGNVYIADYNNRRIRKVDVSGTITTVAGAGLDDADGIPATDARLLHKGIALDGDGNLYIADYYKHRIRKVDATGTITTVAGNGTNGFSGDGGSATQAQLYSPSAVALDAKGNLYIADGGNRRIRKVDASGTITTVAGNGAYITTVTDGDAATETGISGPNGLIVDQAGNLYFTELNKSLVFKVTPEGKIYTVAGNGIHGFEGDGGPALEASIDYPYGLAVDAEGHIYIADTKNNRIRRITDETAPAGYSVAFGQELLNAASDLSAVSFSFSDAEINSDYTYTISSEGGGTPVSGSGTITSAGDEISGIDVSGLEDGTLTLTVTLTDQAGNTGEEAKATIMKKVSLPAALAQDFILVLNASGEGSITVEDIDNGSSDNAGTVTLSLDQTDFTCADLGANMVTLSVTDEYENTATTTATVTVKDETAPVVDTETLAEVSAECSVTVSDVPTASDNCGGTITATTNDPLTYDAQGTYTITWSFDDGNGNVSTQQQQVIVKDETAPVFTCPADVFTEQESGLDLALKEVSDNCGVIQISYELSGATTASGTGNAGQETFQPGETTVTYTVADGNGNSNTCSFNVTFDPVLGADNEQLKAIRLYPNPADNGQVSLELGNEASQVRIVNMNGATLYTNDHLQNGTVIIDVSGLPKGIYFVHVLTASHRKVMKLVLD